MPFLCKEKETDFCQHSLPLCSRALKAKQGFECSHSRREEDPNPSARRWVVNESQEGSRQKVTSSLRESWAGS